MVEDNLDQESGAGVVAGTCAGKMCTANEHCCDKHVCVDADESKSDLSLYLSFLFEYD